MIDVIITSYWWMYNVYHTYHIQLSFVWKDAKNAVYMLTILLLSGYILGHSLQLGSGFSLHSIKNILKDCSHAINKKSRVMIVLWHKVATTTKTEEKYKVMLFFFCGIRLESKCCFVAWNQGTIWFWRVYWSLPLFVLICVFWS